MMWLIFLFIFAGIAAAVLALIALIRRIRKKPYAVHWRISELCLAAGVASLIIGVSGGQWNTAVVLASVALIVYGICQAIILGIRKIAKKSTKHGKIKTLASLGAGIAAVVAFACGDLSSGMYIFALLFFLGALVLLVVNVVRAICRKKSLFLWLSAPACLTLGIALVIIANISWNVQLEKRIATGEIYEEPIQITYDFEVVDGDTPIEVVSSRTNELIDSKIIYVYEEQDLHLAFEDDFATAEECIAAIRANDKIDPKFVGFFCDFVERIENTYPGLNLAILYHNLETLEVQELNARDYLFESLSWSSLGCYNKRKNTIFIPEGTVYIEGEFGFQVLVHEFCHALRSGYFADDDRKSTLDFYEDSENMLLSEAMNSVFSCSLLNYYEWDIAYQVPSNYLRIMLECMDNYSLEDYVKRRDTYFLSKLDEFSGRTNYAQVLWKLIALQRSDWEDDKVDIPAEEYYPIFDFLCELYYEKYITDDMTDEEKRAVADELVRKAFYDAPENYKINENYFYEYLGLQKQP